MDGVHRGVGHQRRKRTISGVRIEEQEYSDGSVTVFVNYQPVRETFERACARIADEQSAGNRALPLNAPHTIMGASLRLRRAWIVLVGRVMQALQRRKR